MPHRTANKIAKQLTTAYKAPADGVRGKELTNPINTIGLPEKYHPTEFKKPRGRLAKAGPGLPSSDGESSSSFDGSVHSLIATIRGRIERARA